MILIGFRNCPYLKFETLPDFQFFHARYPLHIQDWNFRSDGNRLIRRQTPSSRRGPGEVGGPERWIEIRLGIGGTVPRMRPGGSTLGNSRFLGVAHKTLFNSYLTNDTDLSGFLISGSHLRCRPLSLRPRIANYGASLGRLSPFTPAKAPPSRLYTSIAPSCSAPETT